MVLKRIHARLHSCREVRSELRERSANCSYSSPRKGFLTVIGSRWVILAGFRVVAGTFSGTFQLHTPGYRAPRHSKVFNGNLG